MSDLEYYMKTCGELRTRVGELKAQLDAVKAVRKYAPREAPKGTAVYIVDADELDKALGVSDEDT